jgi:hypothetical protein
MSHLGVVRAYRREVPAHDLVHQRQQAVRRERVPAGSGVPRQGAGALAGSRARVLCDACGGSAQCHAWGLRAACPHCPSTQLPATDQRCWSCAHTALLSCCGAESYGRPRCLLLAVVSPQLAAGSTSSAWPAARCSPQAVLCTCSHHHMGSVPCMHCTSVRYQRCPIAASWACYQSCAAGQAWCRLRTHLSEHSSYRTHPSDQMSDLKV